MCIHTSIETVVRKIKFNYRLLIEKRVKILPKPISMNATD